MKVFLKNNLYLCLDIRTISVDASQSRVQLMETEIHEYSGLRR